MRDLENFNRDMPVAELIKIRKRAQQVAREVEWELANRLGNFKGSVKEAILEGLVKPNFPTPPHFMDRLKESTPRVRKVVGR
jgi:hypothetical protein